MSSSALSGTVDEQLYMRKAELANAGGSAEEIRAIWQRLQELDRVADATAA